MNLRVKTEPVTTRANATVYVWFLGQIYSTYTKARYIVLHLLQPCMIDSVFKQFHELWDSVAIYLLSKLTA